MIQARSTSRAGQWCSATRLDALVRMSRYVVVVVLLSRGYRVAILFAAQS